MLSFIRRGKDLIVREFHGGPIRIHCQSDRNARLLESAEAMLTILNVSLDYLDRDDSTTDPQVGEELKTLAERVKTQISYVEGLNVEGMKREPSIA